MRGNLFVMFGAMTLVAVSLAIHGQRTLAGDDGRSEGEKLLKAAEDLTNIKSSDSPPFQMIAHAELIDRENQIVEVSYKLQWNSPEVWRETVTLPNYWQIRLQNGSKLWVWRSASYIAPNCWRALALMESLRHARLIGKEKVGRFFEDTNHGSRESAVEVTADGNSLKTVYINPAGAFPTRVEYGKHAGGGGFEYKNFVALGPHQFPTIIAQIGTDRPGSTVQVEELKETTFSDAIVFTAPEEVHSVPWCANPSPPEQLNYETRFTIPPGTPQSAFGRHEAAYGVIGRDGQWHALTILESGGKEADALFLSLLGQERYRPANCNGSPIDWEMVREEPGK